MHFPCHLAPWGMQSDDLAIYNHWNLAFALEPLVLEWEYTHNLAAAAAVLPLFEGALTLPLTLTLTLTLNPKP